MSKILTLFATTAIFINSSRLMGMDNFFRLILIDSSQILAMLKNTSFSLFAKALRAFALNSLLSFANHNMAWVSTSNFKVNIPQNP